jgi:1,4-dihydroxy-2-naphthoate octaprenyltransferase
MDEQKNSSIIRQCFKVMDPWKLFLNLFFYSLGVAIVHFQNKAISWSAYISGQAVMLGVQISAMYLVDYFARITNPQMILQEQRAKAQRKSLLSSTNILQVAFSFLTIAAVFSFLLISQRRIHVYQGVVLVIIVLLWMFLSLPPLKFKQRGAGELVEAIVITNLIPTFALSVQTDDMSRLLVTITLPLLFLCLPAFMAITLPDYGKKGPILGTSMMEKMGWQGGMLMHNILIPTAYLLMMLTTFMGQPWKITWPGLLSMPVAILQVLQMIAIGRGAKPRWRFLQFTSYALPVLAVYLFLFTLWIK